MTISYPLSLPNVKQFATIQISASSVVGVSESPFTLSQQVQVFPGQRWALNVTTPPLKRPDFEEWKAFLLSLNGREGTFLCGDPMGQTPRGVGGDATVNGGSQTGKYLNANNAPISTTGWLKKGDYIHMVVDGNYRLHAILQDVNTDGSGVAQLPIWPALRGSPPNGTAVVTTATLGQFRLVTSSVNWSGQPGGIYSLAFGAGEVV